jgi:TPR repeat protein
MNFFRSGTILVVAVALLFCYSLSQLPTNQDDPGRTNLLIQSDRLAALKGGGFEQLKYVRDLNEEIFGRRKYTQPFLRFQRVSQFGSPEAIAWRGSISLLGDGVAPDQGKAHEFLTAAPRKNDKISNRFLGIDCDGGIVEKEDYLSAFHLYQSASQSGDAAAYR